METVIIVLLGLIVVLLCGVIWKMSRDARASSRDAEEIDSRLSDNRRQIGLMLAPLREQLEGFRLSFTGNAKAINDSQQILTGHINALVQLNRTIGEEARQLSQALRGSSQVRGAWGEQVLETLLQKSGLSKGVHYHLQVTRDETGRAMRNQEGKLRRPDAVVLLTEGRKIIIDSKVTLNPYLDYYEAADEGEKKRCLRKLVDGMYRHVEEIAKADYPSVVEGSSEIVLMFVPIEGAFIAAYQSSPELLETASRSRVIIVPPSHLFSMLRMVDFTWQSETRQRNAEDMGKVAGELYDKVADFLMKFENVGRALAKAQDEYNKTVNSLMRTRNSVKGKALQLKEMGAKATKYISPNELKDEYPEEDE